MPRLDHLFNRRELDDLLEEKKTGLRREVASMPDEHVLAAVEDEWSEALADRYGIEVPRLRRDELWQDDPDEIQFDVSHEHFQRALPRGAGPFYVPGRRHVVHVPFDGDPEVFFCKPSTWTTVLPVAAVQGSDLLVVVEYPTDSRPDVAARVSGTIDGVERWLAFAAADIAQHNAALIQLALQTVQQRRIVIESNRAADAASGIPIRRSGDGKPPIVPAIRRRPSVLPARAAGNAPITLDPSIGDAVFGDVVRAIAQAGRDMERDPKPYADMSEEDRRQVLLAVLNGQYRGMTTAEAFNRSGKTDLRIMHEGQNLFVGECKIWSGAKRFLDTVEQLFGYGGWRDTKLAVVMFVNQPGMTDVVEKAAAALEGHAQFVEWRVPFGETELHAAMRWAGDDERIVDLAVLFISTSQAR